MSTLLFTLPVNAEFCFTDLTDEQAGRLIKDLLKFHRTGLVPKYGTQNKVGYYFKSILFDLKETYEFLERTAEEPESKES